MIARPVHRARSRKVSWKYNATEDFTTFLTRCICLARVTQVRHYIECRIRAYLVHVIIISGCVEAGRDVDTHRVLQRQVRSNVTTTCINAIPHRTIRSYIYIMSDDIVNNASLYSEYIKLRLITCAMVLLELYCQIAFGISSYMIRHC